MEIWKDIKNWESFYQISSFGRVRSVPRVSDLIGGNRKKYKIILTRTGPNIRYPRVRLSRNGRYFHISIHRAVAEAFIPNPDMKQQVNHINGNKLDYRIENLEWCTNKENAIHAYKNGLNKRPPIRLGSKHHKSKLKEIDIPVIRQLIHSQMSLACISRIYNISPTSIAKIRDGVNWSHIK